MRRSLSSGLIPVVCALSATSVIFSACTAKPRSKLPSEFLTGSSDSATHETAAANDAGSGTTSATSVGDQAAVSADTSTPLADAERALKGIGAKLNESGQYRLAQGDLTRLDQAGVLDAADREELAALFAPE